MVLFDENIDELEDVLNKIKDFKTDEMKIVILVESKKGKSLELSEHSTVNGLIEKPFDLIKLEAIVGGL